MTHMAFEGYMGAKRKALVEKHGFDTKNAAHLIRLMRMAIEFLKEGKKIRRIYLVDELMESLKIEHSSTMVTEDRYGHFDLEHVRNRMKVIERRGNLTRVNFG